MDLINSIKASSELRKYWESLLGKELLEKVIREPDLYSFQADQSVTNEDIERIAAENRSYFNGQGLFDTFFDYVANYIENQMGDIDRDALGGVKKHLIKQIAERLSWTCIRCLINEMHSLKQSGQLHGNNSEEEYHDYLIRYLKSREYVHDFLKKYPVIAELIIIKTKAFSQYIHELVKHLNNDKQDIADQLCGGKSFENITEIKIGLSDEHASGKTVARLTLDNGEVIYYKPHDLSLAIYYNEMYGWLLAQCGLDSFQYKIVNRETYGWEAEVKHLECKHKSEIEEYYRRIGIQLCLAYVLGVTDIHFENMISHGRYPVIIDLEFFGDRRLTAKVKPDNINEVLMDTVMNTGILPVNMWCGQNVNMGGLGESGEQRSPVQMPTVVHKETSDMAIAYEYPKINSAQNLPELRGEKVEFKGFIAFIIGGFEEGYRVILNNKDVFTEKFGSGFNKRSRFIMRNTQEYFMYQNSLNFPGFMADAKVRQLMLAHMDKGLKCERKYRSDILKYEMASIYHSVIPVFYAEGRTLCFGNGKKIIDYFPTDGKQQVGFKVNKLSEKDLRLQLKVIEADFLSYGKAVRSWKGRFRDILKISELTPIKIADLLMDDAFDFEDGLYWTDIKYNNYGKTYLGAADWYLYGGLCGIGIFYAALCKCYGGERYGNIRNRIIKSLFAHTDGLDKKNIRDCRWGLFTGEASLIYTYLVLHEMTSNEIYLRYAEKQCSYLLEHLNDIQTDDLLEGKAGIIIILSKMYEVTGGNGYLEAAEFVGERLKAAAVILPEGLGWSKNGNSPLAGMAHGSSGIALAWAYLWRYTEKEGYLDLIRKTLRYEDSLYNPECSNWMDIRNRDADNNKEKAGQDMVAWCHGAGGIFAARLRIHRLTNISMKELFHVADAREDAAIGKVIDKIKLAAKTDMCLCHGNAGLLEILNFWRKSLGEADVYDIGTFCRQTGIDDLSLEDVVNPGFMMGLSGIGYAMLIEENPDLPDILCLM